MTDIKLQEMTKKACDLLDIVCDRLCDTEEYKTMDCGDWIAPVIDWPDKTGEILTIGDYGTITPESTDDELGEIKDRIVDEASSQGYLVENIDNVLRNKRQNCHESRELNSRLEKIRAAR